MEVFASQEREVLEELQDAEAVLRDLRKEIAFFVQNPFTFLEMEDFAERLKGVFDELTNDVIVKYFSSRPSFTPEEHNRYRALKAVIHDANNFLGKLMARLDLYVQHQDSNKKSFAAMIFFLKKINYLILSTLALKKDKTLQAKPLKDILKDIHVLVEDALEVELIVSNPDRVVEPLATAFLYQILDNLAVNAEKAGASTLRIRVEERGTACHFDVEDNGQGFALNGESLEAFAERVQTSTYGVHGNGLAIACGSVTQLGGAGLRLRDPENRKPGAWFTFSVELGRLQTPPPAPTRMEP